MSSSDAPSPPGGPLRDDAPEGGLLPGDGDSPPPGESEHGSDDAKDVPPISHEKSQSEESAQLQQENAETSLDQPST